VTVKLDVGSPREQLEVQLRRPALEPQALETGVELGGRQTERPPAATHLGKAVLGGVQRVGPLGRKVVEL
jgi:hypothetical protein